MNWAHKGGKHLSALTIFPEASDSLSLSVIKSWYATLASAPVVTQVDEWDESGPMPDFATSAQSQNWAADEERARQQAIFNHFSRNVLGNSSAPVSTDDSDSDMLVTNPDSNTIIVGGDARIEDEDQAVSSAPHPWTRDSLADAQRDAARQRAFEEQYSWMTEEDQHMFRTGLQPVQWEQFEKVISQNGEMHFNAIEQRRFEEEGAELTPGSLPIVGATIVVWSLG
jgi:hypothetical protein